MTVDKNNIAIIGAGVIGVTTAIELQEKGYNVTLIDHNGIAYSSVEFVSAGYGVVNTKAVPYACG